MNIPSAHKVVVWRRVQDLDGYDVCLPYLKYGDTLYPFNPVIWTTDLNPETTPRWQRGQLWFDNKRKVQCLLY